MQKETFVDEAESKNVVIGVMSAIGIAVLGTVVALVLAWAYAKDRALFIAIFAGLMFAFCLNLVIYFAIVREAMSKIAFRYYMGLTCFAAVMNLMTFIFFLVKATQRDA